MDFTLRLPISPRGKAAPLPIVVGRRIAVGGQRAVVGAFAKATKAPKTRAYEAELVALVLAAAPAGLAPVPHYALDVAAVLPATKAMRARAGAARWHFAPVKPDADNIVKSAQDALTVALRHVLGDDARCVLVRVGKLRSPDAVPELVIRVYVPLAPPTWLLALAQTPEPSAIGWQSIQELSGPV